MSQRIKIYKEQQPHIHKMFELKEKLAASDGYKVYQEITKSRTAIFIYNENYRTLIKTLNRYYLNPKILSENPVKRLCQQRYSNTEAKYRHLIFLVSKSKVH